jgi:hypothetical protein
MKLRTIIVNLLLASQCSCIPPKNVSTLPSLNPDVIPHWVNYETALSQAILGSTGGLPEATSRLTQSPRWMLYEAALSKAVVFAEDGLCEWEIWGVSGNEVYGWALCTQIDGGRTSRSVPIVIYLGDDGQIEKAIAPRPGHYGEDVSRLFPVQVQGKINAHGFDATAAAKHIVERMQNPGIPPIIVQMNITLP